MTFKLEINCDNAAFDGDPAAEVETILREIADEVSLGKTDGVCIDTNGNSVGSFAFKGKRKE